MPWRRRATRPLPHVELITRGGCHLCVEMEQVVREVLTRVYRQPPEVLLVDVDHAGVQDPDLLARYSTKVPVLIIDGREIAHWQVTHGQVRGALLAT